MFRRIPVAAAAVAALALAPAALAHVEVTPARVAAGSTTRLTISVPSELPGAATVGLTVKLPARLRVLAFEPKRGWKRVLRVEEGARIVSWSGGRIAPGRTSLFVLRARLPRRAGLALAFPALQTYSNGDVVHWIGPSGSDEPAPVVALAPARSRP
jgi:uncharacterized protein YcnI